MKRQAIVAQGTVEGLAAEDQGITVFRGVPFAQPPVGGLRWRAPQPALPWDGVLQAFDFGPTAMQPTPGASDDFYDREWGADPAVPMSEDCLYLNIWTPALRGYGADSMVASEKLPVMVWIYGGAYQCGGTFEKEFDGTHLAANGVVVVSVAYRLNAFGFMTHPLLHEEAVERGDGEPYANFGFLDQRAGIQWGEGKHREVRRRSGKHHGFRSIGRCRQRLGPDLLADESWPVSESHHAIRRRPRAFQCAAGHAGACAGQRNPSVRSIGCLHAGAGPCNPGPNGIGSRRVPACSTGQRT